MTDSLWNESEIRQRIARDADLIKVEKAITAMLDIAEEYEAERSQSAQTITSKDALIADLQRQLVLAARPAADVYVTVGSAPYAVSQFRTGMQLNTNGLLDGGDLARQRIGTLMQVVATHVMNFGAPNIWPDPSVLDASLWNWARLDQRLQMILAMGATPALVFYNYPVWMKELVDASGVHPMDPNDPFTDNGRVAAAMYAYFDIYVYEIAKRYLVAPYNVRFIVFGNELKGYYIRRDGQDGYDHEEYTTLYNRFVVQVERAALDLGIDPLTVRLGGCYAAVRTLSVANSDTVAPSHPLYGKAYGEYKSAPLDALEYWLQYATRKSFIAWDMGGGNSDGIELANTFAVQEAKYTDMALWARILTDLPMIVTEFYPKCADDDNADVQRVAAAKTVAHLSLVYAGYEMAWLWGATGDGEDNKPNGGLLTGYADTDITQPFYDAYQLIRDYFTEGAQLYPVTIEGEGVYVAVTDNLAVLVNTTNAPRSVCVDDTVHSLAAYEVKGVLRAL